MAHLLIVDDEPSVCDLLGRLAEQAGHEYSIAHDGFEALISFHKKRAQLAIIDLFMPQKGGLETIAELKKRDPALKILAISGGGGVGSLWQVVQRT